MARYKDTTYLQTDDSTDFDRIYEPGDRAPRSGIYRCPTCGQEETSKMKETLPPHPMGHSCRKEKWQLIVSTALLSP